MTTINKIRTEIEQHKNDKFNCINIDDVLKIIDKYAEQAEIQADYDRQKASGMTDEEWEYGKGEQEPNIEKLKDKLHDKIEIHVCEVEENTLIAQGMLKALGMMDEVLEKAEQEPCRVKNELNVELNELKPCDDVVSRQAVLEIIDGWYEQNRDTENIEDLIVLITYMDSVRPQEQTGHWNLLDECANSGYYCSICQKKLVKEGWSKTVKKIKFCPNCGADMRVKAVEDDN